ncbi:MAG TPA: clan AA aspartic protease [Chthonomonadaceae bacterium]|nr:clan AA aspartic protease [Chthonomonadaceae bacterium]
MTGRVLNLHALVPVTFRLPNRSDLAIEFVVNTGYTGFLTLPPAAIAALGLPFEYDIPANLADDTEVFVPVHSATILWNGKEREVRVLAIGKRPLLGTAFMGGKELLVQFADNGLVTLDDLVFP